MELGFGGEVVDFYHRYRRGYPAPVLDAISRMFGLADADDVVLDLGCGTGQLTLPMAARMRAVIGVDPEPDMLVRARRAAVERGIGNITWVLGSDNDLPALGTLLGPATVGAVTIGQALHWMDPPALFHRLFPMLRPGGGVAVVTNGTPLWLQDTAWSRALREVLAEHFGRRPSQTCGTDAASQQRYRDCLREAGYHVAEATHDYSDEISLDQLVGGVYSALALGQLPPREARPRFAERIRRAVQPHMPIREHVSVRILAGRRGEPAPRPIA